MLAAVEFQNKRCEAASPTTILPGGAGLEPGLHRKASY